MKKDFDQIKNVLHSQFKNILLPISSEFYQRHVMKTAVLLANCFQSTITLLYIIEEKTLDTTDRLSNGYRTVYDIEKTKREIIHDSTRKAANLVFSEAEHTFRKYNIKFKEKIVRGEYSPMIKQELPQEEYDLILMGFEKKTLLHYRLLNEVAVPIWVEAGNPGDTILAVCSNLAPNQKVPIMGMYLSHILKWKLQMLYVIDIEDTVMVDSTGRRSAPKSKGELTTQGNEFMLKMKKKGFPVHLTKGGLEKETLKHASSLNARLVIIGREQKKKQLLNPFSKGVKRRIVEHTKQSLLFIN